MTLGGTEPLPPSTVLTAGEVAKEELRGAISTVVAQLRGDFEAYTREVYGEASGEPEEERENDPSAARDGMREYCGDGGVSLRSSLRAGDCMLWGDDGATRRERCMLSSRDRRRGSSTYCGRCLPCKRWWMRTSKRTRQHAAAAMALP